MIKVKSPKFKNQVRIHGIDQDGKPRIQIALNTLTYAAADTLINALLSSGPARVTHLYAQYGPNGTPPPLPSDLRTTERSDLVATGSGYGGIWIPILAAPTVSSTDTSSYQGNVSTFFFRIPGSPQSTQLTGIFTPGTSMIYALALAVATNANDRNGDLIISILNSFTPFTIATNGQEAVDYPFQITI